MTTGKTENNGSSSKAWAACFNAEVDAFVDNVTATEATTLEYLPDAELPRYTAIETSRGHMETALEIADATATKILDPKYLLSRTNPLFADPLNTKAIGSMFNRFFTAASAASPALRPALLAYHFFLGAVSMLPDQLIPALDMIEVERGYDGPAAEWNASTYGATVFLAQSRQYMRRVTTALQHEFFHLLQEIRGVQLGWNVAVGIISEPETLAQMRVAYPMLKNGDRERTYTVQYYEAVFEHHLLKTYFQHHYIERFLAIGDSRLSELAEALRLPPLYKDSYGIASAIYDAVKDHMMPLPDLFLIVLSRSERKMVEEIRLNDTLLYQHDPAESEAYGFETGSVRYLNPLVTLQANGTRGLIQMPASNAQREKLFDQLVESADKRKSNYLTDPALLGAGDLLGGIVPIRGGGVIEKYSPWLNPEVEGIPSIRDINRLSDKVSRTADKIFDRAASFSEKTGKR